MLLGCIADDFTGATDLANNLVRTGLRVVQTIGVPLSSDAPIQADAVVVALKSRTTQAQIAVEQSLAALRWLQGQGAAQIYFKVCSTFDSTASGNIGPVGEALMAALGADFAPVCPAFPENQRTVFKGHLFVGDSLLSDSSMRHHPLTPMTDSSLVRVMQAQCAHRVGLIDHAVVSQGVQAVRDRMQALRAAGVRWGVVDAINNADLMVMGRAFADLRLLVAGSGVAIGLAQNHGIKATEGAALLPPARGQQAIVSGSCSVASNAQVQDFIQRGGEAFLVDPLRIALGDDVVQTALAWASARATAQRLLFYATAAPQAVQAAQSQLGSARAGELVEQALAAITWALVERGVRQLVVAGGETSGACVQALQVRQMRIGPQIDPGVPWCYAQSPVVAGDVVAGVEQQGLHLALKSGNFGGVDFFTKAFSQLV